MSTVTLLLSPDTERKLRDFAGQRGQTFEAYLQLLIEKAAENGTPSVATPGEGAHTTPASDELEDFPGYVSQPTLTLDELDNLLDELSAGPPGKVLPPDFSRADIYDDHD
jgi:hypothetical protein